MPRNVAKPIDDHQRMHQCRMRDALQLKGEDPVTVVYEKRNGDISSSTGTVVFFNGRIGYDTGSVTLDTPDKGPRTINLHRIAKVL